MGRHENLQTGAVVSVDDAKDDRFSPTDWKPAKAATNREPAKKAASSKSDK